MATTTPIERSVGWALLTLLILGSVAAIAADLTDGAESASTAETVGGSDGAAGESASAEASGSDGAGLRSFTIAAAGELLIHESVAGAAAIPGGWDFSPMLASVAPILSSADLAICHVETPMSPDNSSLSYYPVFNVPNELATAIAGAGFDTCSVASNHALDTGRNGVEGTLDALEAVNVRNAGMARSAQEAEDINLISVNGVTVAHLSYTEKSNLDPPAGESYLTNIADEDSILRAAGLAKAAGAEFVIVSLHWGTEYSTPPDATQLDLGPRLLGSPSIDLVIGHGTHVVQPVANLGGEYIVYGLGNFLSNQAPESCTGCPPGTQDGVIVDLTVTENDAGEFLVTDIGQTPTWVDRTTYEVVPVLSDSGLRDPSLMAASADRTSAALSGLGVSVPSRRAP